MPQMRLVPTPETAELASLADLLVLAATESAPATSADSDPGNPKVHCDVLGLDEGTSRELGQALRDVGGTGKAGQLNRLPGKAFGLPPLLVVGLGSWPEPPGVGQPVFSNVQLRLEALRRAAGAALLAAQSVHVALALPTNNPQDVGAVALGGLLGAYRYPAPRAASGTQSAASGTQSAASGTQSAASGTQRNEPTLVSILAAAGEPEEAAAREAEVVASAVNLARLLVQTPPGALPPAALADAAQAALADTEVGVEVLDEGELAAQGYGGILAVGQGSANPPRLVRIAYAPSAARSHLALVGKGITFDSGGLSLKPSASMVTMKCDMGGAAAVLGAVQAIARLKLPIQVTAYLAIAENMPSGHAQRPGDVITAYGGRTVEVLNTDAEGRLVMMDAFVRAGADNPDLLVDVATLTGAQIVALGSRIAAVMANEERLRGQLLDAAAVAGELLWPMPIPDDLRASLDSTVADMANIGEKNGGMLTAAAFLRDFVPEGLAWAHMDIAGPAFNEGAPWAYTPKGGTGYGVRTLIALAQAIAAGSPQD